MHQTDHRQITIRRVPDFEGDNNRGWTCDALDMLVDGEPAGYLKISYIPTARFAAWYPHGAWDYERLISGKGIPKDPSDLAVRPISHYCVQLKKDFAAYPTPEAMLRDFAAKYAKKFEHFKHYFVDRPLVGIHPV